MPQEKQTRNKSFFYFKFFLSHLFFFLFNKPAHQVLQPSNIESLRMRDDKTFIHPSSVHQKPQNNYWSSAWVTKRTATCFINRFESVRLSPSTLGIGKWKLDQHVECFECVIIFKVKRVLFVAYVCTWKGFLVDYVTLDVMWLIRIHFHAHPVQKCLHL